LLQSNQSAHCWDCSELIGILIELQTLAWVDYVIAQAVQAFEVINTDFELSGDAKQIIAGLHLIAFKRFRWSWIIHCTSSRMDRQLLAGKY
jgi:hypothetical protein